MNAVELAKAAAARASLKSRPAQRTAAQQAQAASQFEDDFNLVCEHNNFTELERMEALDIAKGDKAGARECFGSIAASLRRDGSHVGINDRIRARIASEQKAA